ncbi:MAG: 30S ribosome-binding factor RbfA [Clostridiales bacterium]|nr:30S ribosome-binding factor RbfA [Clostridiales bacterium]
MRRTGKIPRNDRLNGEFQKEIYEIISRKLKNPLITEMFSVLRVDCSNDLSYAKVYISVYSKDEAKKQITFKAIQADAKKIRFELAKVIRARTVPELHFVLDDSMEYGDKMDKLFKSINQGEKRD